MRRVLCALVLFFFTMSFAGFAQTTPDAIAYANKAIKAMEPMPPTMWKARMLLELGVLFAKSGNAPAAARLYKQAQSVSDNTTAKTMYGENADAKERASIYYGAAWGSFWRNAPRARQKVTPPPAKS